MGNWELPAQPHASHLRPAALGPWQLRWQGQVGVHWVPWLPQPLGWVAGAPDTLDWDTTGLEMLYLTQEQHRLWHKHLLSLSGGKKSSLSVASPGTEGLSPAGFCLKILQGFKFSYSKAWAPSSGANTPLQRGPPLPPRDTVPPSPALQGQWLCNAWVVSAWWAPSKKKCWKE